MKLVLGPFPAFSIAEARAWAQALNEQVEAGVDPRLAEREETARAAMTVARAHALYMEAAREGRSSRAKRRNKPRTIQEKLEIYNRDIGPILGRKSIHDVTEADLVRLVSTKGRVARIRANRLAAELKVFFGWAASLRGMEVGLESDPSRRLHDLRFPETAPSAQADARPEPARASPIFVELTGRTWSAGGTVPGGSSPSIFVPLAASQAPIRR